MIENIEAGLPCPFATASATLPPVRMRQCEKQG